jgi:hypothetical protein
MRHRQLTFCFFVVLHLTVATYHPDTYLLTLPTFFSVRSGSKGWGFGLLVWAVPRPAVSLCLNMNMTHVAGCSVNAVQSGVGY